MTLVPNIVYTRISEIGNSVHIDNNIKYIMVNFNNWLTNS